MIPSASDLAFLLLLVQIALLATPHARCSIHSPCIGVAQKHTETTIQLPLVARSAATPTTLSMSHSACATSPISRPCRMTASTTAMIALVAALLVGSPAGASLSDTLDSLRSGSGSQGTGVSTCSGIGCNSSGSSQTSVTVPGSGTPTAGVPSDNDGNEGNEGNEGDEGRFPVSLADFTPPTASSASCAVQSNSQGRTEFESAHASAVSRVFAEFCSPTFSGGFALAAGVAHASGEAIASALAATQAECTSAGDAFACATASATAEAWARATVTGHAEAVAIAADQCDCLAGASSISVGSASLYINLMADAFASAEVIACSSGDGTSFASAYASCSAASYATVWTTAIAQALLEGGCFEAEVATSITAEVEAQTTLVEGCDRSDFAFGDAAGSTTGSGADAAADF
eukprot:jgi/Ulvmu1/741/UM010_0114.1